jgi:hypothetical protein
MTSLPPGGDCDDEVVDCPYRRTLSAPEQKGL